MKRRLRLRRRARSVIWGARPGDRVIGSSRDLYLARRELELELLERRLRAVAYRRLKLLARQGAITAEALERMADAFTRLGAAGKTARQVLVEHREATP